MLNISSFVRQIVSLVLLVGVFFAGILIARKLPPSLPETPVIVKSVQTLSQLVTVKYVMDKIVTKETDRLFYNDKILLVAHGEVKAGIDLGKLRDGDIKVVEKRISIRLPHPEITDAALNEQWTHVYDRATGLPFRLNKDLETLARREALAQIRAAAVSQGIHKDAAERARTLVEKLCLQMGFESVEVIDRKG